MPHVSRPGGPLPCATALLAGALFSTVAAAQTLPPPVNVVSLSASATVEVAKDLLTVVFSTTRDGSDAGAAVINADIADPARFRAMFDHLAG